MKNTILRYPSSPMVILTRTTKHLYGCVILSYTCNIK
jgi:hypothetical protein